MSPTTATERVRLGVTPDWLTTPIEFDDHRAFRNLRRTMQVVVVLAAAAILWAALAPIRELSLARGEFVPASQIRPVQHLEGGIAEEILVAPGQVVDKGQPLIRLQAAAAESELAVLRARTQNLLLLKERVTALLAGRTADFSSVQDASPTLVAEHLQVYQNRLEHRARERHLLLTRIAQRTAEIEALQIEIATERRMTEIQKEQLDMRRELVSRGSGSRKQMLDSESEYEKSRALLQTSEGRLAAAREGLLEAQAALAEADAKSQRLWSEELAQASSELAETQEQIGKYIDRVERLTVRAPAHGRVQQMLQRSPGEVVRPGETIARIVPQTDELVAEVRVRPEDIASVQIGNKAELKVTAYDFSQHGKIRGNVAEVSPSTIDNEDKRTADNADRRPYYKVTIRLDQQRSDQLAGIVRFQPGMTVDAEIISGSKTLLQYLLRPIYRGVSVAFSER